MSINHRSDCALHNEPAYPAGPCDCGAGGWQPIETAPDGDILLLGWWCEFLGAKSWECEVEFYGRGDGHCATHWMHLPSPPETEG